MNDMSFEDDALTDLLEAVMDHYEHMYPDVDVEPAQILLVDADDFISEEEMTI